MPAARWRAAKPLACLLVDLLDGRPDPVLSLPQVQERILIAPGGGGIDGAAHKAGIDVSKTRALPPLKEVHLSTGWAADRCPQCLPALPP
eukprot:2364427-Alexandrium_andersonii.AAC.1